ncbi:hypothetical protein G6Z92_06435 [Vibrio aestuarianus subsp. cardii]|uniref:hypothetical protein n=1 Tax=Vibrio aestuarianus TaxID=28171 RepID=UPI0015C5291C|nr:hypothetical protein [Vibrio aestuarianus]NGZ66623.1 hypothetical protein [Vibrio aestuarianus subsp. cardii]
MAKKPVQKKREYSRPSLTKMLRLNTQMAQDAYQDYVKRTMAALYRLDVILFFIGSEEMAEAANISMEEELRLLLKKQSKVSIELRELMKKIEEEGNELDEPEYPPVTIEEFKIYSPLCATYLKVINMFENNIKTIEMLWLNGEMTSRLKHKKIRSLSIQLRNISHKIINKSRGTMELARSEGKDVDVTESIKSLGIEQDDGQDVVSEKQAIQDQIKADKELLEAQNEALMKESFSDVLAQAEERKQKPVEVEEV